MLIKCEPLTAYQKGWNLPEQKAQKLELFQAKLQWSRIFFPLARLGTRAVESESEGFSTWGVGVAENFNESDSGKPFCSLIVTVCATNVRKRHTWQLKQLDASTRDDHGYSDRRQRTNLHTFTQGPFQISSVHWAHHPTYTVWMQPFVACNTGIAICSFWLALSLPCDDGYATINEKFSWELVHYYVTYVTEQW